jgi:GAF domain-containing protein
MPVFNSAQFFLMSKDDSQSSADEARNSLGFANITQDVTRREQAEEALLDAGQRAISEYERLLDRLVSLADTLGGARDLITIFRALRDFALASVPSIGIFVSLYDAQRGHRTAAYAWGDKEEFDVSQLPPMPITPGGPNSQAITTGKIVITDDYMERMKGHRVVAVGSTPELMPQSSMVAPMIAMNRIVGTIEVQSYERAAYKDEHVAAMRMASNLAAIAIENARLFERESRARSTA